MEWEYSIIEAVKEYPMLYDKSARLTTNKCENFVFDLTHRRGGNF